MDSIATAPAPTSAAIAAGEEQRALWTAWHLAPEDPAYNMTYAVELAPGIDPQRLAAAFAQVIAGHEALSSHYREDADGRLVMERQPGFTADVAVHTTVAMTDTDRLRWLEHEADLPLPLDRAVACRVRLLAEPGGLVHLLVVLHHIAGDYLSFEILCEQAFTAYEEPPVAGSATGSRYFDWLERQRALQSGPEFARLEAFWRKLVTDAAPPPELPADRIDRPGPPNETDLRLDAAMTARVRAAADRAGVGVFPLLTAVFQIFLHRWSGQERFMVGTPVSGRQGAADRAMIGYTLNALPWPADLSGNPTVADLARTAQRTLMALLRHRRLPLARITALAGGNGPLFRHMTTYVPVGERAAINRAVRRELFAQQRGAANELNLRWVDDGERLTGQWRADPAVFAPETSARMRRGFLALLDRAITDPDVPVATLEATADDADRSLRRGPAAGTPTPALALFEAAVARHPGRAAVEDGDRTLTYADLDAAAGRLARRLAAAGVRPGDHVGLWLPRGAALAVGMIAAWKAGAAYLCLDPALPDARLAFLATDSGARAVVGHGAAPGWLGGAAWLEFDGRSDDSAPGAIPASPDLPAYLIYTSGSTGTPKGVVVTQGNLAQYAQGVLAAMDLPEEATLATLASVTADLGYTAWFGALLGGRTLRVIPPALADDPDALARHFAGRPVDALKIVPSHLAALMAVADPARLLPRRCLVLGGEALEGGFVARLRALAPGCRVLNHYGPTETTVGCLTAPAPRDPSIPVPIGAPLAGVHAAVLDRHGDPVPLGVVGELAIGGCGVAAGYLGRPALTAERFVPDPWRSGGRLYRTGDRVRLTAAGLLEFLGRADDQVKIRGFRVELGEVESWLRRQPGVVEAAVLARPATSGGGSGLRLAAFVAPATLDADALRTAMAAALPDAMVPSALHALPALPRLPNGKIDRKSLPDDEAAAPTAPSAGRPLTDAEQTLAAIWAEVLGRPSVGVEEDFFSIGGDSILALQVIAKARPKGLALKPKLFFQKRTIGAIAAAITAAAPRPQAPAESKPAPVERAPFALSGLDAKAVAALHAERPGLEDAYPLSSLQQGLLFHGLIDPAGGAYVNQLVIEAEGPFDADAFTAAWQDAVAANPILRTAFRWDGVDRPLQLVERTATLSVARRDWSDLSDDGREAALAALLAEDRARGFALDRAPLMRLALIRCGSGRWWLLWSRHHLVVDGWCSILLVDEVLERYRARLADESPALPARRPFRDHIAWVLRQDDRSAAGFWRTFLAGVEGATPLPMLSPAPESGSVVPLSQSHLLDEAETARLAAAARGLGVTLNTLVQGAWGLVLAARSGRNDVLFGVTSSGRPAELDGAEHMLGVFINTLPLRVRVPGQRRLGDYLRGIQADNAAMREHEHSALADIQAQAGVGPLFDTLLVFQNLPMLEGRRRRVGALDLRQRDNVEHTHYALTVEVFPGDRLAVAIDADGRRIDAATLARIADGFRAALLSLTRGAGTALAALPRMGEAEAQTLRGWSAGPASPRLSPDWVERVAARAEAHPDRIAARCEGSSLTYGELWQRSERLARGLDAAGLRPDELVALLAPRGLELLCLMVAVLRAGGAWLPLDPAHPPARWAQVMEQAGHPLLIRDEAVPCGLPALTIADLLARAGDGRLPAAPPRGDQRAYVLFTSGSTGTPKGAMVTRDGMLNNMLAKVDPLQLGEQDVIAQTAPSCFDISVWQTLTAPLLGAVVEIIPDGVVRDPDALLDRLAQAGVTLFEPVPSLMRTLAETRDAGGRPRPLPALRWVLPTGEALSAADAGAWFDAYPAIPLMNAYGPAECADDVAFHPLHAAPAPGTTIPIGRPTAGAELRIVDGDLAAVPMGTVGEIAIGGIGVGRGYLGDPRRTALSFIPDPDAAPGARLYRTGDLGRWSAQGVIEWAGRGDFQMKLRGFRIEAGEVEATLERHPAVRRAVVQVRADHLTAWWEPAEPHAAEPHAEVLAETLAAHAAETLPSYMVPTRWVRMTAWPRNANGKLDRKALPDAETASSATADEPPATETERRLAQLWQELMPGSAVGRNADFFALGGHSLLAARLIARLRRDGWPGLPLRTVFEASELRALAARLDALAGAGDDDTPPLRPVERREAMPLSPAQQRLWLVDRLSGGGTAYLMAARLDLSGDLDAAALETALNAVVARHEILRTAYPERDEEPAAIAAPALSIPLPLEDLSGLPPEERESCARAREEEHARTPFDLAAGPLLRARLLRMDADTHRLLFAMHHMIADGWSVGVLCRDLAAAYRAARAGEAPDWPPLPVQYADYAVWQRTLLSGERLAREIAFWRDGLAGAPTVLALPTDRPRPAIASTRGDSLRLRLDAGLLARVEDWARRRGATPFMALLAAFNAMLHRETGANDLLVGTDTAGRPDRALEGLIGFFVNVVPLRSRLEPGVSFDALLDRTRQTALDAFDHDALPFDRIVEAVGVPRDRGRNPLVQVLFVLQNVPGGPLELPDLVIAEAPPAERQSKFDMALFLEPVGGGSGDGPGGPALAADWVFASSLFDPTTVRRFHDAWVALLERAVADPSQPVLPPFPAPSAGQEFPPMDQTRRASAKLSRLGGPAAPCRPARLQAADPIRRSFLTPGSDFPIMLEPATPDLDPVAWAEGNRGLIDDLLLRHGAILFRGFALPDPQAFECFAEAMEPTGLFGSYGDLPKKEGGRNTYRSTPYPERQMILYHNESSHLDRWPRKQWFFAEQVAPVGGCTPIVDCRRMLTLLPADLVTMLETRGLLYVRTFTPRLDVDWRDFFKTDDRAAVEAHCAAGGIDLRWLDPDTPQTRTRSPAVIRHPLSGERSFFNQMQLHHPACLEPEVRADLLEMAGIERFPRNVLFGDGETIPDETMALIGEAYEACAVRFQWLRGDVVMVDNMLTAHARDPFEGPRRIVVAMGAIVERRAVEVL
ncbi:non-ribosomal peptide synthetase [Azospirillum sp. Sh1]|uniref:non-ribosomal peptide synthetase n=1 Tax=Azospirillum sp. Sh1 TaxID=2607285 RepID=UPI00165E0069|nr:non-ribosomal peptide synthetase [Azospirillum sp. Sh1]